MFVAWIINFNGAYLFSTITYYDIVFKFLMIYINGSPLAIDRILFNYDQNCQNVQSVNA